MILRSTYQLVILGAENSNKQTIIDTFLKRVDDLGLSRDVIVILDKDNFLLWNRFSPTVAAYFGGDFTVFPDIAISETLLSNGAYIIPIVEDINNFPLEIPELLQPINGTSLNRTSIDGLVSTIMEGFGLLRMSRRLFISYKRAESTALAIQLYEELDSIGFDVFIDTHSVRKGIDFQEELWHRLADSDVVVLIDTPKFRESKWTSAELGQASAMSVGIYQLIWPGHSPENDTGFCVSKQLHNKDFNNLGAPDKTSTVNDVVIKEIKNVVESLRARNLAARQNLLIKNFLLTANNSGRSATLQPEKFIVYKTALGIEHVVIPAVGVPDAYSFHYHDILIKKIHQNRIQQVNILYDQTNIKKIWQQHLFWLNEHLPVKSVDITDIDNWVLKN